MYYMIKSTKGMNYMQKINFVFIKNNERIIEENNINCITNKDKTIFKIDGIKYTYLNNIIIKEDENHIITLDFNERKCIIYLKEINNTLVLEIKNIKIKKDKNIIKIEYKIESEENTHNIISIEYKKSS